MSGVLGEVTTANLPAKMEVSQGDAAGALANMLPGFVERLTRNDAAPAGGLGNSGALMHMLGGLLQRR